MCAYACSFVVNCMKAKDVSWVPKQNAFRLAASYNTTSATEEAIKVSSADAVFELTKKLDEKMSDLKNTLSNILYKESISTHNLKVR